MDLQDMLRSFGEKVRNGDEGQPEGPVEEEGEEEEVRATDSSEKAMGQTAQEEEVLVVEEQEEEEACRPLPPPTPATATTLRAMMRREPRTQAQTHGRGAEALAQTLRRHSLGEMLGVADREPDMTVVCFVMCAMDDALIGGAATAAGGGAAGRGGRMGVGALLELEEEEEETGLEALEEVEDTQVEEGETALVELPWDVDRESLTMGWLLSEAARQKPEWEALFLDGRATLCRRRRRRRKIHRRTASGPATSSRRLVLSRDWADQLVLDDPIDYAWPRHRRRSSADQGVVRSAGIVAAPPADASESSSSHTTGTAWAVPNGTGGVKKDDEEDGAEIVVYLYHPRIKTRGKRQEQEKEEKVELQGKIRMLETTVIGMAQKMQELMERCEAAEEVAHKAQEDCWKVLDAARQDRDAQDSEWQHTSAQLTQRIFVLEKSLDNMTNNFHNLRHEHAALRDQQQLGLATSLPALTTPKTMVATAQTPTNQLFGSSPHTPGHRLSDSSIASTSNNSTAGSSGGSGTGRAAEHVYAHSDSDDAPFSFSQRAQNGLQGEDQEEEEDDLDDGFVLGGAGDAAAGKVEEPYFDDLVAAPRTSLPGVRPNILVMSALPIISEADNIESGGEEGSDRGGSRNSNEHDPNDNHNYGSSSSPPPTPPPDFDSADASMYTSNSFANTFRRDLDDENDSDSRRRAAVDLDDVDDDDDDDDGDDGEGNERHLFSSPTVDVGAAEAVDVGHAVNGIVQHANAHELVTPAGSASGGGKNPFDDSNTLAALDGEDNEENDDAEEEAALLDELCNHALNNRAEEAIAIVELIPHLADSTQNRTGFSPLHHAAFCGSKRLTEYILTQTLADVNVVGKMQWTPLHLAAYNGHQEVCDLLIGGGADLFAQDCFGAAPKDRAKRSGHTTVVWSLLQQEQAMLSYHGNQQAGDDMATNSPRSAGVVVEQRLDHADL